MVRIAAALIAWACMAACAPADEDALLEPIPEYHLKCIFLFNFGRFVEWPQDALDPGKRPFTIGVVTRKRLEGGLALIKGKNVKGRPVEVVQCDSVEDMHRCHIVFLNSSDKLWVKGVLLSLRESPVLTVGESEGFCRWGGAINFHAEGQSLRLEISPRAARRAGLRISAQLLELARIVDREAE